MTTSAYDFKPQLIGANSPQSFPLELMNARIIVIYCNTQEWPEFFRADYALYEPLCDLLLFPFGQGRWNHKRKSQLKLIRCLLGQLP